MRIALASLALILGGSCWDRGKEAVLPEPELVFTDDASGALTLNTWEAGANNLLLIEDYRIYQAYPQSLSVDDFEGHGSKTLGTFDSAGRFTLNRDVCK